MSETDRRVRLVYVLAALSARTIGVDAQIVIRNFHLHVVVLDLGDHVNRTEGSMPAFIRVEGADSD